MAELLEVLHFILKLILNRACLAWYTWSTSMIWLRIHLMDHYVDALVIISFEGVYQSDGLVSQMQLIILHTENFWDWFLVASAIVRKLYPFYVFRWKPATFYFAIEVWIILISLCSFFLLFHKVRSWVPPCQFMTKLDCCSCYCCIDFTLLFLVCRHHLLIIRSIGAYWNMSCNLLEWLACVDRCGDSWLCKYLVILMSQIVIFWDYIMQ